MKDIPKTYDYKSTEDKWYKHWEEKGYFQPREEGEPFSIVIPPPNVTGRLHMGHALNNTLQDIIVRYKRMNGFAVMWIPGTDHAGIATQNVVERYISQTEGKTRWELGREEFIKRVWEWKKEYGDAIINQLKKLGASCDWSKTRFTMDEGLSKAVRKVFVELYNEGLIYKGNYIINWCPKCFTALSDLEVEYEEENGKLYYIKYPIKDSDEYIIIATTRPETMLGDTAVAVNPEDERYKKYIGKTAILPLVGRELPIIADPVVSTEFGTGALKVTPSHDPVDFELGKKHNLEFITIMDRNAVINENGGKYRGLDRYEARKKIVEDLEKEGYLVKIEDYVHSVGHCYRCHTTIEPYVSEQWFVKTKPLAEPAIEAVKEGRTRFIPSQWDKTYFNWMENIKDWCISRQIWWGHQIPAWYCKDCGKISVSEEDINKCLHCGSENIERDEDVLDTWFSSALWPFSTMGWPQKTELLERFYPTSLLVTGFDIIFFWVARMMMMGLHFMKDVPFKDVYIHALVLDEKGEKMSKTRGNVIDPLDMIEKYGADALRFTLAILTVQGRNIKLSEKAIEGYKHFANKLWNASRFVMMNIEDYREIELEKEELKLIDKYIIGKLNETIEKVTNALENYLYNEASYSIYDFIWHTYCDWYIELSKPHLQDKSSKDYMITINVLVYVLREALKLLHPFMPFITEEIWNLLNKATNTALGDIIVSSWPKIKYSIDKSYIDNFEKVKDVIVGIRSIRGDMNIPPKERVKAILKLDDTSLENIFKDSIIYIETLSRTGEFVIDNSYKREKYTAFYPLEFGELYVPLEGIIDIEKEKERLKKKLKSVEKDLDRVGKKLSNKDFVENAPKEIVEKEKERYEELKKQKEKIENNLRSLE